MQSVSTMLKHVRASQRAYAPTMPGDAPSNAQTDRQTYKHQPTLSNHPPVENARRGAERFPQIDGKTAVPAALRAGLIGASHA